MGNIKKRKIRKRRNSFSFGYSFLRTWLLLEKKIDVGCGFISCSRIWQTCINVIAFQALLSTSFLVTAAWQYCKKSVLAARFRLFSNRKQEIEIGKEQLNGEGKKKRNGNGCKLEK